MPYKRRYKKRTTKKKRRYVSPNKPLLGNTFTTKLKYYSQAILNPGAGTQAIQVFRANDLFDPDYTYTGHQPRGFDQLMPLYDHFVVVGSKITIKMAHPNESPILLSVALKDSSTNESSAEDYTEGRNCKYTIVPSHERGTLTQTFSPKSFFTIRNPTDEKDLYGTITSSPTEQAFYHIACSAPDGVDVLGCTITAMIEYVVKFIEPKQPISS